MRRIASMLNERATSGEDDLSPHVGSRPSSGRTGCGAGGSYLGLSLQYQRTVHACTLPSASIEAFPRGRVRAFPERPVASAFARRQPHSWVGLSIEFGGDLALLARSPLLARMAYQKEGGAPD